MKFAGCGKGLINIYYLRGSDVIFDTTRGRRFLVRKAVVFVGAG